MAYVPTTFVDRSVEFPNRRKLTSVSGQADTFDVERAEGTVFAEGTKPDAANLNAEFGKIKTETDAINTSLNGFEFVEISPGQGGYKIGGADPVIPFKKFELVNLGSGNSFDMKSLFPEIYNKLTPDDFIVSITGAGTVYVPWQSNGDAARISSFSVTKNYNSATGILTIDGCADSITLLSGSTPIQQAQRTLNKNVFFLNKFS